jgi:SAM-dependent methyltransferase
VNSILVARVLHFVPPAAFQQFLGALRDALKPGGRVVVTGLTPWNSHFQTFLPTYQANLERGDEWPGWGMRPAEHNPALAKNLPEVMNMLDLNVLGREFIRAGFRIIRGAYIDRRGQYPDSVLMNGREGVGIIAERIGG